MFVAIHPGAMALTRMPSEAHATANDFVNWTIAALLAPYAGLPEEAKKLVSEAILIIAPLDPARRGLNNSDKVNIEVRLTSITRRKISV